MDYIECNTSAPKAHTKNGRTNKCKDIVSIDRFKQDKQMFAQYMVYIQSNLFKTNPAPMVCS